MSPRYSLANHIAAHAQQTPAEPVLTLLTHGESDQAVTIAWSEIDRGARAVAAQLRALGPAGSRAIVACSADVDHSAAFYGCLYAGWIPVRAPAPSSSRPDPQLGAIAARVGALVALTTVDAIEMAMASSPEVAWMALDVEHPIDLLAHAA